MKRLQGLLAPVFVVYCLLTALPAVAKVITVDVNNLAFLPPKISAHVGDTVQWTNKDFVAHSATAHNHDWDVSIPANGTGSTQLQKAGHMDYYCKFHPAMRGSIDVE